MIRPAAMKAEREMGRQAGVAAGVPVATRHLTCAYPGVNRELVSGTVPAQALAVARACRRTLGLAAGGPAVARGGPENRWARGLDLGRLLNPAGRGGHRGTGGAARR